MKTELKKMHQVKSYGKNKKNTKNVPKKADFPCILIQKLKLVATGSGW